MLERDIASKRLIKVARPGRKFSMRAVSIVVVLVAVIAGRVTPASAMPVVATLQGCVSAIALPDLVQWTGSTHLLLGSFHDPTSGCDATEFAPLYVLERLETQDTFAVLLHKDRLDPACGRYQFDVEQWDDRFSMVSLVIDFGEDCAPVAEITGVGGSGGTGSSGTPSEATPVPVASRVPEPATLVLTGLALAVACTVRRCRVSRMRTQRSRCRRFRSTHAARGGGSRPSHPREIAVTRRTRSRGLHLRPDGWGERDEKRNVEHE